MKVVVLSPSARYFMFPSCNVNQYKSIYYIFSKNATALFKEDFKNGLC